MKIFLDAVDYQQFVDELEDVSKRFAIRCWNYCLMPNHYHATLQPTLPNFSEALRRLNSVYAQWWNRRHERVGHVFQARFNAQIVQDDAYLVNVCRYIVLNPVRAGMVRSPEQWPWSSYRAMAGLASLPPFLDCNRLLELVAADDPTEGRNQFRRSVLEVDALALQLPRTAILGDDAFVARFQPYCAHASREVPRREGRRTLDAIFHRAVTRVARNTAIVTAFRERYALAEIARYLEVHPSTISKIVSAQGAGAWRRDGFKT